MKIEGKFKVLKMKKTKFKALTLKKESKLEAFKIEK